MATSSINRAVRGPAPQRLLIVDDSTVARAVLARAVSADASFVVAGAVSSVARALEFLDAERVDVILLDLELPGVGGLAGLPELLAAGRGAKVLIVSSLAGDGAASTVQALALGAADTLEKPGQGRSPAAFAQALIDKLIRLTESDQCAPRPLRALPVPRRGFDLVAIGASTGGIHAIGSLLCALPRTFSAPIVVTQHLPRAFIPYFADQLHAMTGRPCHVATDRMAPIDGAIIVAPGDAHIVALPLPRGRATIRLSREPVPNGNLPSVDPMFASLAECYGARLLAVILSGMGRDGIDGAARVRACGGTIIAQDAATSVVWGMPGAVVRAGLADAVLPPDAIARFIAPPEGVA